MYFGFISIFIFDIDFYLFVAGECVMGRDGTGMGHVDELSGRHSDWSRGVGVRRGLQPSGAGNPG